MSFIPHLKPLTRQTNKLVKSTLAKSIRMSSSNPTPSNTSTNTNPTTKAAEETPSMLASHGQYVKGYVSETIGNLTGSKEWQESGKQDAKDGIEGMKAANAQRKTEPAPSGLLGKAEELAGKATGCEGMVKEGVERQDKAL